MRKSLFSALVCLLAAALPARAQEEGEGGVYLAQEMVDHTHEFVSLSLESTAQWLDSFFGGDRAADEETGTWLRVRGWWLGRGEEPGEVKGDAKLRLVLPRTQEKLQFELTSDRTEKPEEERSIEDLSAVPTNVREEFLAGLRAVILKTLEWHASFGAGIRVDFPMDPYARAILRRTDRWEEWRFRVEQSAFWYLSDGYGFRTTALLDRRLDPKALFRSTSSALWTEDKLSWELGESLGILQEADPDTAMAYLTGVIWESEPVVRASQYFWSVTYRRRVYSTWLFFDLQPGMSWPRSRDFAPSPWLLLRLEMFFGKDRLTDQ